MVCPYWLRSCCWWPVASDSLAGYLAWATLSICMRVVAHEMAHTHTDYDARVQPDTRPAPASRVTVSLRASSQRLRSVRPQRSTRVVHLNEMNRESDDLCGLRQIFCATLARPTGIHGAHARTGRRLRYNNALYIHV